MRRDRREARNAPKQPYAKGARTGAGIDLLRAAIARLLAEQGAPTKDIRGHRS